LVVLVLGGLALLYRLAPSRKSPRWTWVSWGAAIATLLWIAASAGFSFFVSRFGNYSETYGALAGVVVLLMWLWLSAFAALVGAEINSEMEHQTRRDTTTGAEKPMGARGAWSADHVADVPGK
jgi:membrane protein